jgi:hypothetical protein
MIGLQADKQIEIIVPISLTPIQKRVYRGILEKNADLIKAVMAQRKKKPKPVPAITGGEIIIDPTTAAENGTNGHTEPDTNMDKGETIIPPTSATNDHENATDVEMNGSKNDVTTVSVNAEDASHEVPTSANQPALNGAQESVDEEMVVDTDNTDSALVEDTI